MQDPVALFEVQVQGSGRVQLAEGGTLTLGFDGSNNRPHDNRQRADRDGRDAEGQCNPGRRSATG